MGVGLHRSSSDIQYSTLTLLSRMLCLSAEIADHLLAAIFWSTSLPGAGDSRALSVSRWEHSTAKPHGSSSFQQMCSNN